MTKKPPRYRPATEPRPTPLAGFFKCGACGKTLPDERREQGLPAAWIFCRGCWAGNQRLDPWKNPLGPSPTKDEVARGENVEADGVAGGGW